MSELVLKLVDNLALSMESSSLNIEPVKPIKLEEGKFIDIVVSFTRDASTIFVQPQAWENDIQSLITRLQAVHSGSVQEHEALNVPNLPLTPNIKPARLSLSQIAMGCEGSAVFCVAPDTDGCFYRAQIVSRTSPSKVEVVFVDYGNRAQVSLSELYTLEPEFRKLPPAAIEVKMINPLPAQYDTDTAVVDIDGQQLVLHIHEVLSGKNQVKGELIRVDDAGNEATLKKLVEMICGSAEKKVEIPVKPELPRGSETQSHNQQHKPKVAVHSLQNNHPHQFSSAQKPFTTTSHLPNNHSEMHLRPNNPYSSLVVPEQDEFPLLPELHKSPAHQPPLETFKFNPHAATFASSLSSSDMKSEENGFSGSRKMIEDADGFKKSVENWD